MGILNVTPDSFSDGGKWDKPGKALGHASELLAQGADIIDIGGVSTRPGAPEVSPAEELGRILPVIEAVRQRHPEAIISADTSSAEVAKAAVHAGADMVNDISGGAFDERMHDTIAGLGVPYVVMHTTGKPGVMQSLTGYRDVVTDVAKHLSMQVLSLREKGVADIIIDPGFGFGKDLEQNFRLLSELGHFSIFGLPVMVGVSRKSMIYKALGTNPGEAVNGSTVLHTLALLGGASILRVHDPAPALEAITLTGLYLGAGQKIPARP